MRLNKYIRLFSNRIKILNKNKKIPLTIILSVTNRCNLNCVYCTINKRLNEKEMTKEEIYQMVDEISPDCINIHLSGGEPLLREDIEEITDYINKKDGIILGMVSNGLLLKEKINVLNNIDYILLSLDGSKDEHELNRGKGTFEKVLCAINVAKKMKVTVIGTTVLTVNNIQNIDSHLKLIKKIGVPWNFQPVYEYFLEEKQSVMFTREEFLYAIKKIINFKYKTGLIVNSSSFLNYLLNYQDPKNKFECFAGRCQFVVDTQGYIDQCCYIRNRRSQHNIKNGFYSALRKIEFPMCDINCGLSCYHDFAKMLRLNIPAIVDFVRTTNKK